MLLYSQCGCAAFSANSTILSQQPPKTTLLNCKSFFKWFSSNDRTFMFDSFCTFGPVYKGLGNSWQESQTTVNSWSQHNSLARIALFEPIVSMAVLLSSSALAEHVCNTGHPEDWGQTLVWKVAATSKRCLLESWMIHRQRPSTMNKELRPLRTALQTTFALYLLFMSSTWLNTIPAFLLLFTHH